MKRKIILSILIVIATMCLLAVSIGATPIEKDTTVTLNGTFTVGEESVANPVVNLYDENGYALVWYLNADNKLVSERAVDFITVTDKKAKFSDLSKVYGKSQQSGIVVVNLRDDLVEDGLDEIETFDSNFQFGRYGGKKTAPIQYFYFPKTATEIIDRMFQETQAMIVDIEPNTPITRIGIHAVLQSNLKEFLVPKGVTSFIEADGYGVFQDTQLEKIVFEEGSQITVIPYRCFYMCSKLKELILPNTVEEIHERALQFTLFDSNAKLEKIVLGASFKGFAGETGDNFYVRGANNAAIYLPATFTAENVDVSTAHQYFTNCGNATFYYCGTEAQWDALIAKISEGKNGAVGTDSSENIVTAKSRGKVVFEYNECEAFYKGVHTADDEKSNACVVVCEKCGTTTVEHSLSAEISVSIVYADFSKVGSKVTKCTNEGCILNTTPTTEELGALFTCLGHSAPEFGNGGMAIGFKINHDDVKLYEELTGKTVNYGLFAVSKAKAGTNKVFGENGELLAGAIATDLTSRGVDLFELRITGFTEDSHKSAEIAMGGYVKVTDATSTEYSYMQAGTPEDGAVYEFVSYNKLASTSSNQ